MLRLILSQQVVLQRKMNDKKENCTDICKMHSSRIERDLYKVCPSKLSKRELEDMYFALVGNNIELKKTVNGQKEQIKLLNTKVQRMLTQRPANNRDMKECCTHNRAIINDQKEMIADLKRTNDRLTERIRILNMRLCSAKQFLKKGVLPGCARCSNCSSGMPVSNKNSSSALNIKTIDDNIVKSATASCQYLANEMTPVSLPIQETSRKEQQMEDSCDQKTCRSIIEELKDKTISLQQELSQTHDEYISRIKRLEEEVSRLNQENLRVRTVSTSSENRMEQQKGEILDLLQKLRKCEAQCEQLAVQLKIEKSRAAELEMRAKAADMSSDIANAIEKHLANINVKKDEQEKPIDKEASAHSFSNADNSSMYHCQFQLIVPNNSVASQTDKSDISSERTTRTSDDSGYTDTNRSSASCEESPKKDIIVMNKIAELQAQLDNLKQSVTENCEEYDENDQRRKSRLQRKPVPSSSKDNEAVNCLPPPMPGDSDYLIRTNRLNSSKSTHEWCKEYEKSDADSSIAEYGNGIKEKDGQNSKLNNRKLSIMDNSEQDYNNIPDSAKPYAQKRGTICAPNILNNVPTLDLRNINETKEISKTYRKTSSLDGIDQTPSKVIANLNVSESNDSFNFTKETITKVDGVLITESIHQIDSESSVDVNVDNPLPRDAIESNNYIADNLSDVIKKTVTTTTNNDPKPFLEQKTVSTNTGPLDALKDTPQTDKFKDAFSFTDEANPLVLLENNRLDICEQSVRVCTCPISSRRAMSMFRSCSGTLRFTTTASKSKFRKCSCGDNRVPCATRELEDVHNSGTYNINRTSTPIRGTYVLQGEATVDVMSPENTHREMSSLSDLPTEREISCAYTSPGEDKATCTQSDDTPRSTTDYGSLSEGELPITERRKQSVGETESLSKDISLRRSNTSTSEKMEETLKAISQELAKCRHLLQVHTSHETMGVMSQDASCMTEKRNQNGCSKGRVPMDRKSSIDPPIEPAARNSSVPLRKCDANPRVGGTSPKCVFTLHVGTVILADEAVINSRSKSLALTWRFYNQPPTMTHQLAGRVMHFDFSLEYDIRLTQHFLDYLKHKEMPIIVCEINKQETPFASCSLPLRDALLHTNRRVDMSLALIAGSGIKQKDTSLTNFDVSKEIGVLDVWCMLRVPSHMMGVINDVISQTIASFHHNASSLERIVDDDQTDFRLGQDLDMRRTSKSAQAEIKNSYDSENIYDIMNSKKWRRASALKHADGCRKKSVTILQKAPRGSTATTTTELIGKLSDDNNTLDITILWLALNEESRAMTNPKVKRLYVAFTFLGKSGADMETPSSLPKPRNFMDKCHFNFRKSFVINEADVILMGNMANRRQDNTTSLDPKDCIVFSIISEPPEDPLGLEACEDIGYAYLYLGDVLSSRNNTYTEVLPIRNPNEALVCGRLAVRVDGLPVLRACVERAHSYK